MRLDLSVNILTNHAYKNGKIRVFGGAQYRPNIHIEDVTDLYVKMLELPAEKIAGKIWNAGYENQTINEIAGIVEENAGREGVEIAREPTNDLRSYRISSEKIKNDIGFVPQHSIADAVTDLVTAFNAGIGSTTLPLYIYSAIKFGVSPEINAISTIVVALTALALLVAWRLGAFRTEEPRIVDDAEADGGAA